MNKLIWAHLAILLVNLVYGVNYSVVKEIMPEYLGPYGFAVVRVWGAGLLFWLTALWGRVERVSPRDYGPLLLASLMGVIFNGVSFLKAISLTTPINASIILTSNPIFVVIIAALFTGTRITWLGALGIAMGLLGAALVILQRGAVDFGSDTMLGNVLMVLNAISYATYLVYLRRLMLRYQSITVVRWMFVFGAVLIVPIGGHEFLQISWPTIPAVALVGVAFVVLFTTFLNYLLINYSVKYAGPTVVSAYTNLQPVVATFVAVLLGQDSLDVSKVLAAFLVLGGVYLVGVSSRPRKESAPAQGR